MKRTAIHMLAAAAALGLPTGATAVEPPLADPTVPPARDTEPVVLTGSDLAGWAAPANVTVRLPLLDLTECRTFDERCRHNHYAEPNADSQEAVPQAGPPVERILGYRWTGRRFKQVRFQVDERFVRYLANPASGFSVYSGEDRHLTYAFDREGFRYTRSEEDAPCVALPDSPPAPDPVPGLDADDEVAFMARDAGPRAPSGTPLPRGIEAALAVAVRDPLRPVSPARYVYVMRAGDDGPERAHTGPGEGYVSYERDPDADLFERSESTYEDYGNAARGPYCDAAGNLVTDENGEPAIARRRPRDTAWVTTPRYRFRYDGRWLMTQLRVSADGGESYGPDLIDRWKARAFAQDPGSETPCCGFEEEDTNWGGSSTLLGERTGPVRAIRETWGADSGTNVIRRETFYRDEMRQASYLRVHPIPPLDGIYSQWDFNAGRVTRFSNPRRPGGVPIDGQNDEALGNFDDPCNPRYDGNGTGDVDQGYRSLYRELHLCEAPYHQSVDAPDLLTHSEPNVALGWSQTSGPHGTVVDRYSVRAEELTPGGVVQGLVAVPYYRDDSCFDDGTGTDPGPKLKLRSGDEPATWGDPPRPRECWRPEHGLPEGSERFYQGSIGTHGVHFLFVLESDNARTTVPVTEITGEQRLVVLPGDPGNVGEHYGRHFEKPLVTAAKPAPNPPAGR